MKDFSKVPYLPLFDSRSKEGLKCPLLGVFTVRSIQYAKITYIVRVKPLQFFHSHIVKNDARQKKNFNRTICKLQRYLDRN